ncbi:MAG: type II toxin-antitoxin system HicA family toxin [Gammaproteobacteria bacterium]
MAKLRRLSGKEVCAILSEHGFVKVRQRGSHIVMRKPLPAGSITIPLPNRKEIRTGTLGSIIRQSKLPRSAFE